MATIRQLRGRRQAMVMRRGVPPRCKSFDKRTDATRWARELEAEADRSGWVADTRLAEKTTLGELLSRYRDQVSPTKRSALTERSRINAMLRRPIVHRTLAEFDFARFLYIHDIVFKFVTPIGVRGKDFDFRIEYTDGSEACADAKCRLEGTEIRANTIKNSLNKARSDNLPPDKPGIIFVKVPQTWLEQDSVPKDMYEVVEIFLESTQRIVSVVVYATVAMEVPGHQMMLMRHRFNEFLNSSHRFNIGKNWALFKDFRVPDEWQGMHPQVDAGVLTRFHYAREIIFLSSF
jgi:hypothetical protein